MGEARGRVGHTMEKEEVGFGSGGCGGGGGFEKLESGGVRGGVGGGFEGVEGGVY